MSDRPDDPSSVLVNLFTGSMVPTSAHRPPGERLIETNEAKPRRVIVTITPVIKRMTDRLPSGCHLHAKTRRRTKAVIAAITPPRDPVMISAMLTSKAPPAPTTFQVLGPR